MNDEELHNTAGLIHALHQRIILLEQRFAELQKVVDQLQLRECQRNPSYMPNHEDFPT